MTTNHSQNLSQLELDRGKIAPITETRASPHPTAINTVLKNILLLPVLRQSTRE